MGIKNFLTAEQQAAIVQAIGEAEKDTSGEIRVHMERYCKGNVLDCAATVFKELKMHKTALRNGVLVYISVDDRKLAILGDAGINTKVPDGFWDSIKDAMISNFTRGEITSGLTQGIHMIGEKLKAYFPCMPDDTNELSNEISFGA
jgi:uncharacterized membrane protein